MFETYYLMYQAFILNYCMVFEILFGFLKFDYMKLFLNYIIILGVLFNRKYSIDCIGSRSLFSWTNETF